jgi:hypothetical protein
MRVAASLTAPAGAVRQYPDGKAKFMEAVGTPVPADEPVEHRAAVETAWRGAANQIAAYSGSRTL